MSTENKVDKVDGNTAYFARPNNFTIYCQKCGSKAVGVTTVQYGAKILFRCRKCANEERV